MSEPTGKSPPRCEEEDREPTLFCALAWLFALEVASSAVAYIVGRILWRSATS